MNWHDPREQSPTFGDYEDDELRELKRQLREAEREAQKREIRRRIRELRGGLYIG